jgi:lipid A 3-O-deacylase
MAAGRPPQHDEDDVNHADAPWMGPLAALGLSLFAATATATAAAPAAAAAAGAGAGAGADPADRHRTTRTQVFVQVGAARDATATVIGATRRWDWQRDYSSGVLTGYWEASFGRWTNDMPAGATASAWITQIGVTPVLRWTFDDSRSWFVEGGIGVNVIAPLYRSGERRFSTAFNFGDHVAIGYRFGATHAHELALRLQHFSNASIKRPNPGADFLQLRYSRAL